MKFFTSLAALLALSSKSTSASTIPLIERAIYGPGSITSPGRNISSIMSWTYAAFAHATITISNSTSELTYLCNNFDQLSSRYYTAFAQPDGDVAKLAKEAICAASKSKIPSPAPVPQNMLWYMKLYTAGIFNVQAYSSKTPTKQWYFDMCYYLEASLLRGLWAPCLDTDEGGVDVESGFCATAGYFSKGPFSTYTNATQPASTVRQVDALMSNVMAAVFKVLVKNPDQAEYVCNNWARYQTGIEKTGLSAIAIKKLVCGQGEKVIGIQQAKMDLARQMTDLFVFQILNAGHVDGYHAYLCKTYSVDALSNYGLFGTQVMDALCEAAGRLK